MSRARRQTLALPVLCLWVLLGATPVAFAGPLDEGHPGGIGFSGPTTGDLQAIAWNPGALGLLDDSEAMLSLNARHHSVELERAAIDPATGEAGGSRLPGTARSAGWRTPLAWPPGPGGFAAVGARLGTRVTLALAAYTPFFQRLSYDGMASRYHALEFDLRHTAIVPALAVKASKGLHFGIAPGFLLSSGRVAFDEDTSFRGGTDCNGSPCGAENPAAAARYDLDSGSDPFDSSLAFTFSGGVLWERNGIRVGLAYASAPFGTSDRGIQTSFRFARVTRPSRSGGGVICSASGQDPCVLGAMSYDLPDQLVGGLRLPLNPALYLEIQGRWINYSRHDRIDIRVIGPAQDGLRPELPETLRLHRGFQDVLDLRGRVVALLSERVRVSTALRAETSAVPAEDVSPATADAFKMEPSIAVEVKVHSRLQLTAGYGFTWFLPVAAGGTAFSPSAEAGCEAARGDLENPACANRSAGLARPGVTGRTTQQMHTLSLSLTLKL